MMLKEEVTTLLIDFKNQRRSVETQLECGIISLVDALEEKERIMKKEIKLKESLVKEVHVKRDGTPRAIAYLENCKMYSTKMPDGRKIRATSYENLVLKLFDEYHLVLSSFSVNDIFEKAIKLKEETKNVDADTIMHNRSTYRRFIKEDFQKKDIRKITDEDLQKYSLKLIRENDLTDKAFLAYKEILNIIFNYAMKRHIISENPVDSIENEDYLKGCESSRGSSETKLFSEEEIQRIKERIRHKMGFKRYNGYFINGYAMLFSIETGMRVAEICSLKWEDIKEDRIHIHSQQLHSRKNKIYYYANWTKDEKKRQTKKNNGGRYFPLTDSIKSLLDELKEVQDRLDIHSEFVFCHEDGEWIKKEAYETSLRRLCRSLGYEVTNNHAFRMSLNSNVFIPLGMPVTMRAELLGHSIETNEKYYSFAQKNNIEEGLRILNNRKGEVLTPNLPLNNQNIIFFEKIKTLETAISKVLG